MKRYQFGVIGLGARGESFARKLYKGTPRAELCGVCDLDADRMEKFCNYCELTNVRKFSNPDEFFGQRDMDGVIVTTPDFTHRDVALQALAAKKHFYLEKPMDVTIERCKEVIRAINKQSAVCGFMGFNMRLNARYICLKEWMDKGILGQIVHIEALEQIHNDHSASFMRRFHRHRARSGGLLNTKSSHDMDMMQWLIGHQHKLKRVAAFGGCNVFLPKKAPAKYCHECPEIETCRYRDMAGFVFPVKGELPIHHQDQATYGGDLSVYNDDKDICDNMTVILEWDSGIRGNFNLQLFQKEGVRQQKIWGENGLMETRDDQIIIRQSPGGNIIEMTPRGYVGAHGKGDPQMIDRFIQAIEGQGDPTMRLEAGLAACILTLKAEEAMVTGKVVEIEPSLYEV